MTSVCSRFVLSLTALVLVAVSGCDDQDGTASDEAPSSNPESAEDFALRAFAALDAADTCPDLEAAWDEYLDPATRAAVRRRVPCTRKVLDAVHPVQSVRAFHDELYFASPSDVPASLKEADAVVSVDLDTPPFLAEDTFSVGDFLATSWVVVSDEEGSRLFNTGLHLMDECLQIQENCRMSG